MSHDAGSRSTTIEPTQHETPLADAIDEPIPVADRAAGPDQPPDSALADEPRHAPAWPSATDGHESAQQRQVDLDAVAAESPAVRRRVQARLISLAYDNLLIGICTDLICVVTMAWMIAGSVDALALTIWVAIAGLHMVVRSATWAAWRLAPARPSPAVWLAASVHLRICDYGGLVGNRGHAFHARNSAGSADISDRPVVGCQRGADGCGRAGTCRCIHQLCHHGRYRSQLVFSCPASRISTPWACSVWSTPPSWRSWPATITGCCCARCVRTLRKPRWPSGLRWRVFRAEKANDAKSRFLANMSHELRTPLNAINGFSEMMKEGVVKPATVDRYQSYAELIHRSGTHLLDLINDVLDLAKAEAGSHGLYEETIDVVELARECVDVIQPAADRAGVLLVDEIQRLGGSAVQADGVDIWADRRKMRQILLNLLANAVKFTPAGGRVSLSCGLPGDGGLVFYVRDTGVGMNPSQVADAMKPFTQVDEGYDKRYQGTGLGLPLTKTLVELHGGTLRLDSDKGSGTTACIWLPATRTALPGTFRAGLARRSCRGLNRFGAGATTPVSTTRFRNLSCRANSPKTASSSPATIPER